MSKTLYNCIIEGDPICDGANNARVLLVELDSTIGKLLDTLYAIKNREDEDWTIGVLIGKIEVCSDAVSNVLAGG